MGIRSILKVFLPLLLLFQQSAADKITHQKEKIGLSFVDIIRHISKQDVRISELESRGKHQEQEMSNLKATVDEDKKEIQFLKNRVALLETLTENTIPDEQHHHLIKRPFRLLPVSIPDETTKDVRPFYGPPTNCSELTKPGYTLNGYYLIRKGSNDQGSIGIVYCRFYQQQLIADKQKTFIGNVQLNKKKSKVHFYVERARNLNAPSHILFYKEAFNIGKAFNMEHGTFSALVAGFYHFVFHGHKHNSKGHLKVYFSLNEQLVETMVRTHTSPMYAPIFLSTYLRLKPWDEIRVTIHGDGKLTEEEIFSYTYFTGYLVEED